MLRQPTNRRRHRSPDEIAEILEEFDRSDVTQIRFAAEQGLSISTLRWWLRRRGQSRAVARPRRFVPVRLPTAGLLAEPTVEIVLAAGRSVRVPAGFDLVVCQNSAGRKWGNFSVLRVAAVAGLSLLLAT